MFRIFFIGVVLFQVFGGTFSNGDCDVLSDICRRDPECADDEVFYSKCMESYGKRNSQDIADQPVAWATKDHPNAPVYIEKRRINYNHFYNGGAQQQQDGVRQQGVYDEAHQKDRIEKLKDLYSDYEKESIRESLLLLKEKLNQRKDTVGVGGEVDPRRFAEKGDAVDSTSQTHGEPNKADTFGKYVNIHKKESDDNNNNNNNDNNNNNNKNIQAKYDDTTNNLQIITTNTDNEITHNTIRQKNDDINNYQTLLNSDNQKDSSVNYDEGVFNEKVNSTGNSNNKVISNDELVSTLSTTKPAYDKEKKSKIINQAFDLVQSMIKERDGDVSVNDPSATPSLVEKQGDELEVYTKPVVSNKRDSVAASQQAADAPDERAAHDKSIVIGSDRSEVAVAEYSTELEERRDDDEENRGLVIVRTSDSLPDKQAVKIGKLLQNILWNITQHKVLQFQSVEDESNAVYRMKVNTSWFKFADNAVYVATKINTDDEIREDLNRDSGAVILSAESTSEDSYAEAHIKDKERKSWDQLTLFSAVIAASVLGLLFAAIVVCVIKRKAKSLTPFIFKRQEAVQDYQELCRTQMSVANSPRPEDETDKNSSMKTWNDEQSPYNMDITTGHVILSYMEDHLKNENRLNKEWEALCNYKADQSETHVGSDIKHATKNRYRDVLPYDHTRVHLRSSANAFHSDYINASFITDTDPKNPSYIATQGPLDNTVADFWQMIWEQGVVVIINLTKLSDMGLPQCHHYWPTDGSEVYHIYEVHLISEHIWCDDYLVRNIYLKNLQTAETRTVTQFHYLTWPDLSIPTSPKPLLEFRRKVNKCYRGHACPVVVHCNNGVGRTGTYILLDMVLNKMIKGTKEIDIAATLEHLRDQRQDVVKTKGQFEFALLAVAEEVTAILSSVAR